mgnify:CR=1 FL=1
MKRFLTILLALFLLVMTMPALAENSEWEFDESKCTLTRYTGAGGEVAVPEKIGSAAVKTLDTGVLAQVSGMTSLTLPETVLHIKDNAGSWNPDLVRLSLPQSLMIIGSNGFNDCDALEEMLKAHRGEHKYAVIVTEGLFSMDGNIPDLPRIIELKKKYDCMLLVDEAHSLGVLGKTGRGAREYYGIDPTDVDMWMSTLSKAMCGCGGFIAGRSDLIKFLKYGSPGFVFSVGMPPVIAAACRKALEIMLREPERVHKLQHISRYFLEYAQSKGLDTGAAQGYAVVPVIVGDSMVSGFLSQQLFKRGIYVMPVSFPAVKEGTARLRFFISAAHTEEHVRKTLDAVVEELPNAQAIVEKYRREHQDEAQDD